MPLSGPETALAARTLELVDLPSPSHDEGLVYGYVSAALNHLSLLHDDGETLLYAKREGRPLVLLAGHTDTVPPQDNLPGRIQDGAVHGLGATDLNDGVNAVALAVDGLREVVRVEPHDVDVDGLVFREVLSVTQIHGGIASNVVPARCEALLNFRYAPGRTMEEAEARVREIVGRELEILDHAPA